ncbi:MAG: S-layer homology domain-containing protein [Peptoniphilus harei]|uniref:S-layer homology domain-containing protein n=1 Tax=Peptoniphilus harei TaxID=54005 RepID=UPI00290DD864|nr:S-layer homology domain-containing protein [Peptoniphilus harei]MDU5471381.1 S-layer homology domain-containing protein [Peptoniphilus harei]MDU6098923.1 S-layer homology domain-containing protein [Peptoniphilus harei]
MRNKKILGLLLAGVMVTSIPFNVFADDDNEGLELSEEKVPVAVAQAKKTEPTEETGSEDTVKVVFKDGSDVQVFEGLEKDKALPDGKKPVDPKKDGFTFLGWYKDGVKWASTTLITEDTIFEAAWKSNEVEKVKVTFDSDGGSKVDPIEVEKGKTVKEAIPTPTKNGFEFVEWQKDGKKFDFETPINENINLKAVWRTKAPETKTYTVTFYSKGGSTVATQTIEEGKTATEPKAPIRTGYTFKGWYTDNGTFVDSFDFTKPVTENTILYAKWEEDKPAVPAKQDLYISDIEYDGNYVTGKVTSKGEVVKDATVTLKIDGSKTGYTDETDAYGRFKVYLGKYYDDYRYYDDDYYYRNGDRYYDGYRVYKDSDGDYYYIKNGKRNYIRYSDYYRRYRDYKADLVAEKSGFYSAEKNLWKDGYYYNNGRYYGRDWYSNKYDHRVYPTDISRSNYSTSGYLKGYKNRTVYVYDDGTYLGSDTIDSDGYFKVSWNSPKVSTSRSLEYYVNGTYVSDSSYSMIPVVNNVSAGAKFVRGNAGAYADVTVYDSNGTRLGGASAGSTGIFNISLNRELKAGETIKIEAKESGKTSRSTEVKIAGQEAKVAAKVNSPSYIAGYPDGTFKPGKEVTRAEAVRMFVTLVNEGKELPKNPTTKFKDANNKWYSDEINFAVSKGFISGYSDGTFKPNQGITRAEFAQMIAVFVKDGYPGSSNFKDVKGHWASNAIDQLYGNKKIKGFPDGTFKPDQKLTRAEAVTVLNSVFGRNTKSTSFANVNTNSLKKFSDVPMSHWAYYQIIDASNGHNAVKGDKAEDVSVWQ